MRTGLDKTHHRGPDAARKALVGREEAKRASPGKGPLLGGARSAAACARAVSL